MTTPYIAGLAAFALDCAEKQARVVEAVTAALERDGVYSSIDGAHMCIAHRSTHANADWKITLFVSEEPRGHVQLLGSPRDAARVW